MLTFDVDNVPHSHKELYICKGINLTFFIKIIILL